MMALLLIDLQSKKSSFALLVDKILDKMSLEPEKRKNIKNQSKLNVQIINKKIFISFSLA